MAIHVAILRTPYLKAVLEGRKTIESRLTRTAQPPYGMVNAGDRIFLKRSGGSFAATAHAKAVHSFDGLTPADIDALRRRFNKAVKGDDDYWQAKSNARFATFIELADVHPVSVGPMYSKSAYKAWFVLPDEADPVLDVELTEGSVRNGYVSVSERREYFEPDGFELLLPDGRSITSDLYRGQRIRWRGWRDLFRSHGLEAGDVARFVRRGAGRYGVSLIRRG